MKRLFFVLAVLVTAGTVLVAAGVGQGSGPPALPITSAALGKEVKAVTAGGPVVAHGEKLFASAGCADCHTMGTDGYNGQLGPRLDAKSSMDQVDDIEKNITMPPVDDKGYEAGLMPMNFAQRLSKSDLHALARYIYVASRADAGKTKAKDAG